MRFSLLPLDGPALLPAVLVVGLLLAGPASPAQADGPQDDAAPASASPATVSSVTLVAPTDSRVRSSTPGGHDSLTVAYEYTTGDGASPDSVTVQLTTATDTAAYTIGDADYGGNGSRNSVTVDLTTPDTTGGSGLVDGETYSLQFTATDTNDNTGRDTATDVLTIDNTAPSTLTVDAPTDSTFKRSDQTVGVTYSYQDAHPDSVTVTLDDGTNTATFALDNSGYGGGDAERTDSLDLSAPTTGSVSAGSTYDLTVTARDSAGNSASASAANRLTVDDTAPNVTNIARAAPTSEVTNASSVTFSVAFSERVENVDTSDAALGSSPGGSASVSSVSASSGRSVDVTVSSISGDGTLDLDVADGDVTDRAGNALGGSSPDAANEETYTIDNTAPTVSDVTAPSDGTYAQGESLSFTVTYDEAVEVNTSGGPPALPLAIDGTAQDAAYASGSGSTALSFEYTVQPGDSTLALNGSSIALNGGALTDAAGNDADLGFAAPSLSGVNVDGVAPDVGALSIGVQNSNEVALRFGSSEPLPTIQVTVDGPESGDPDVFTFDQSQLNEETTVGDGFGFKYRYTLSASQVYDDGGGTYAATLDSAVDTAGNTAGTSATASYVFPLARDDAPAAIDENATLSDAAPGVLSNDRPLTSEDSVTVRSVNGASGDVGTPIALPSGAELTLNRDGSYTYDPGSAFDELAAGQDSMDTFTYNVLGPEGGQPSSADAATVTVPLSGSNDPPRQQFKRAITLPSGTAKTIPSDSVLTFVDPDDAPESITYTVTSAPSNGTLVNTATSEAVGPGAATSTFTQATINDGNLQYQHGGSGDSDTFTFRVGDDSGAGTTEKTFQIFIGANQTPVASSDDTTTTEDQVVTVTDPAAGVLANDSDPDGDPLFVSSFANEPNDGDSVAVSTQFDSGRIVSGVIAIDSSGTYGFRPTSPNLDAGDSPTLTIGYTGADGSGGFDSSTLTITVQGRNDAPRLTTNSGLTGGAGTSTLLRPSDLSASDPDDTASELTYTVTDAPDQGVLVNTATSAAIGPDTTTSTFTQARLESARIEYRADRSPGALSDQFTFDLADDNGAGPTGQTFSITIQEGAPVARNDTLRIDEDGTAQGNVLDNDSDPNGPDSDLEAFPPSSPPPGTFSLSRDGALSYTPPEDANGTYQFAYTVEDPDGNTDDAAVQIIVRPVNDPPTLDTNEPLQVDERSTQPIRPSILSASDVDDPPDDIVFEVTSAPSQGRLLVDGQEASRFTQQALQNEQVAYEHTAASTNDDRFSLRLTDDDGAAPTSFTVDVRVQASNNSPTVTADRYVTREGQTLTVSDPAAGVLGNDRDSDGTIATVVVTDSADGGTVDLNKNSGTFTYTPAPGFSGEDTFEYQATDNVGGEATGRVSIRVRPAQATPSIDRGFPNPTQKQSFRLVALPGSAAVALSSTLPGTQGEQWRAFRETGGTDSTASGQAPCGTGTDCVLRSGTGYWLISRSTWSVTDSIETVSLAPGSSATAPPVYRLPLQDGWTVISNPLAEDVPWSAVQATSGTQQPLYRWDGAWSEARTFASAVSGEAYYFRDDRIDTLVVPYPGLRRAASKQSRELTSSPRRALAIHAVQGTDTLSTLRAGQRRGSSVGLDRTDRYAPPSYFGAVSLRLRPPNADRPQALRAEYRPPGRDGYAYNVRLQAPPDSAVRLVARGLGAFGDENVALVRRSSGRPYNLKADSSITVAPASGTTRFRLLIGSSAFVDDARQDLAPETVTLRPNYPNPFRRTTTLEYSLPERQTVRLAVYDLLGRRVQVLEHGKKRAGFHRLQWDGEVGGRPLASGTYFLRLVAGSTTKTEQLVIVR